MSEPGRTPTAAMPNPALHVLRDTLGNLREGMVNNASRLEQFLQRTSGRPETPPPQDTKVHPVGIPNGHMETIRQQLDFMQTVNNRVSQLLEDLEQIG